MKDDNDIIRDEQIMMTLSEMRVAIRNLTDKIQRLHTSMSAATNAWKFLPATRRSILRNDALVDVTKNASLDHVNSIPF